MALRALLTAGPGELPHREATQLRRLQAQWAELAGRRGEALLRAIAPPELEGPLLCLDRGVGNPAALWSGLLPTLLVALQRAGLAEEAMRWEGQGLHPQDLSEGVEITATEAILGVVADPAGLSFRLAGGDVCGRYDPRIGARAIRWPIAGAAHLSMADPNPIALAEEHPEKSGNALDLGGRSTAEWCDRLREAAALIEAGLPDWLSEAGARAERLMPVGFEPERHLSASYRELPGQLYLTLHPSALTLAEAWVHEAQHGRLNRLLLLDPALKNGRTAWTPSPVRPDLRPLIGVLLAVHAFVPVAALHRRLAEAGHPLMVSPEGRARRRLVLESNAHGLAILSERGEWTAAGAQLFADLRALHAWSAAGTPEHIGDINSLPG